MVEANRISPVDCAPNVRGQALLRHPYPFHVQCVQWTYLSLPHHSGNYPVPPELAPRASREYQVVSRPLVNPRNAVVQLLAEIEYALALMPGVCSSARCDQHLHG